MVRRGQIKPGERYGRLVALEPAGYIGTKTAWRFRCDCGAIHVTRADFVRTGRAQSCGCLHREVQRARMTKHGGSRTAEYNIWKGMIRRCEKPSDAQYPIYGGRGIKVCQRWRSSFDDFLIEMGARPSAAHSIDRIDNDGDYEPGNARWATAEEQTRGRRITIWIEWKGEKITLAQACELEGVDYQLAHKRLRKGLPIEEVLVTGTLRGRGQRRG